jgi:hypothetical protein
MIPPTTSRVQRNTARHVNDALRRASDANVDYFAHHPDEIPRRLQELDREWDIERWLEANAASVALAGVALAATVDRRWLALPALVTAFLLQHATQGWCPPVPVLRRLGIRTANEIEQERHALKALRGDYDGVQSAADRPRTAALAARL